MRSPTMSRLYLQVAPDDDDRQLVEDRIWTTCTPARTATVRGHEGPITETSVTPMRSFVAAPMRHGNLFLAGDAAHIVPPTGAKGLNLAVADVTVLAQALGARFHDGDDDRCRRTRTAAWPGSGAPSTSRGG